MPDHAVTATRPVDALAARSWVLLNGMRTESFETALTSAADQVVLDLEDAVDARDKAGARLDVAAWLETRSAWVRINDRTTSFWADDVDHLANLPGLHGVMLAKTKPQNRSPKRSTVSVAGLRCWVWWSQQSASKHHRRSPKRAARSVSRSAAETIAATPVRGRTISPWPIPGPALSSPAG